ncbi:futalosine hydrolase [Pedobacter sp. MC2016-14]|uniref:futalosine hydrolase n=1 Tax=Pedobacter sp. MC2016-14 TaxID=2897327 RepID=UPI001E3A888C|nr:futalosine hydrolase [Pedobacter sp. MC2016-14]MCD0487130.1 futalosine hydrolase [Pedobacter sp. MC2016-14]
MKTLVVAATYQEISGLFAHFNWPIEAFVQTKDIDVLITGVGMTATAFALGRHLSAAYDLVLNLGIAGAFTQELALGQLVNVTEDTFAELGAEDKDQFLTIDELGFGAGMYRNNNPQHLPLVAQLIPAKGITVNTVHGHKKTIAAIYERLQPHTESMEGAAVFYACAQLSIPCLQVRSISNYVEERNKESWKIGLAIQNLNQWAIDFLTTT